MPLDHHEPDVARTQDHAASDVDHLKTVLFVDYENARQNAARLFGDRLDNAGHFHPGELGRLVCEQYNKRPERRGLPPLKLSEVRVYRGLPHQQKESKRHADSLARKYAWLDGNMSDPVDSPKITVIDPPLHYPKASHPRWAERCKPFEQEVDTQLTVDVLAMAAQGEFDVAILFSEDSDFLPLMHAMLTRYSTELLPQIHRAGWCRRVLQADGTQKRQDQILDKKHRRLRHLGAGARSPMHKLWLDDYTVTADSANYLIGWDELERCYTEDALVHGRIVDCSEDGLKVMVRGAVALAPRSQLADADVRKYKRGSSLWFKVIEFDPRQRRAILSERAARKRTAVSGLKKGDVIAGKISKIRSNGSVSVEYGGVSWLIPNREVSWSHDTVVSDMFQVGQDVPMRVLAARAGSADLRLSMRQAASQEWDSVVARLRTEPFVIAEVAGVQSKRVVNARIEGTYVHGHMDVSQLAPGADGSLDDVVRKGDLIPVKILRVDRERSGAGAAGHLVLGAVEDRSAVEEAGWEFDGAWRVVHVGDGPDEAEPSARAADGDPEPGGAEPPTAIEEALTRAFVEVDRGDSERE